MTARPAVAVTRPVVDADRLAGRLSAAGFEAVVVPLIEIVDPSDGGRALTAELARLGRGDWLVVTSANGVTALGSRLPALAARGVRIAAVGPTTAARCLGAGAAADLVPERFDGAALADALVAAAGTPARALLAVSARAAATVGDALERAGWEVARADAYDIAEADPTDAELAELAACSAITLTSGTAARALARAVGAPPPVVCLGSATAAAAEAAGLDVAAVADPSTLDGLVDAVAGVLGPR